MQLQMMQMENKEKRRGHSGSRTKDTSRKIEKINRNDIARTSNSVDSIAEKEQAEYNKTVKELKQTIKFVQQLTQRKLDLKKTLNLHKNFKNLKPHYDQIKYKKSKDLADAWMSKLSEALIKRVEDEAAKNFEKYVEAGHRLSYKDLRILNTRHKEVYIDQMIKDDDHTKQYLSVVQNKVFDKFNEIFTMIQDISDIKETWDDAQDDLNDRIELKAIEAGVSKNAMKKYKFKQFNIQDMYKTTDGTLCRNCAKNLVCSAHPLAKQEMLKGDDFPMIA